jgi:hypothetical protein
MEEHFFFVLSVLFLVPGLVAAALRPDLRRPLLAIVPFALPFAATEVLFYPAYWQPTFLFDLGRVLGFGLEDVLFVVGLGAMAAAAYPIMTRSAYMPQRTSEQVEKRRRDVRAVLVVAIALAAFLALYALRVHVFYACVVAMALVAVGLACVRRDLALPMLLGGIGTGAVYTFLCEVLGLLVPGVFERHWRTDGLLGASIGFVPIEETIYGALAGAVGTGFLPFARGWRFGSLAAAEAQP